MYEKRATFQLPDCAKHFLDKVVEMSDDSWIPDEQDVLCARVRTTGIVKKDFVIEGNKFQMYDVGGQVSTITSTTTTTTTTTITHHSGTITIQTSYTDPSCWCCWCAVACAVSALAYPDLSLA